MTKEIKEFGSFETEGIALKGCDMEISIPAAKLNEQLKQEVEEYKRIYLVNSPESEKVFFDVRIILRTNHDLFEDVTGVRLYEWRETDGEIVDQSFDDLDVVFSDESIAEIKKLVQERISTIFS
jgi:hypothetical protein